VGGKDDANIEESCSERLKLTKKKDPKLEHSV